MLTTSDKKWVKETVSDVVHEKIAEFIVGYVQPTLATKKDLNKFATKKDLDKFATKKDLEKYATKKDLEKFATKKDLEKLATKKDLEKYATKKDLENSLSKIKESIDNLTGAVDHFMGKSNKIELEQQVISHKTYREITPKIEDHEKRIIHLEKAI